MSLEVSYICTPADIRAVWSYSWTNSSRFRSIVLLLSGIIPVLLLAVAAYIGQLNSIVIAIAVVDFPLNIMLLRLTLPLLTKTGQRTLSISPDGIFTEIGNMKATIPWSKVADVFDTDTHVFVIGKSANAFAIPLSAFSHPDDRIKFIERAHKYHRERQDTAV